MQNNGAWIWLWVAAIIVVIGIIWWAVETTRSEPITPIVQTATTTIPVASSTAPVKAATTTSSKG